MNSELSAQEALRKPAAVLEPRVQLDEARYAYTPHSTRNTKNMVVWICLPYVFHLNVTIHQSTEPHSSGSKYLTGT